MMRTTLTDAQWARMEPHLPGQSLQSRAGDDARRFVEAVLWISRSGAPWRDLPEAFRNWNTVFRRFRHWVSSTCSNGFSMRCPTIPTWSSP